MTNSVRFSESTLCCKTITTCLYRQCSTLVPLFWLGESSQQTSVASLFKVQQVLGNLAVWVHGASIVYPSETFHPPSIVDALVEEQCTALHGVC